MRFLLGAKDPEMKAIAAVLRARNIPFTYATHEATPCHPGNTYSIDLPNPRPTHAVECAPAGGWQAPAPAIIDHHQPGHPGYGRPPDEYLEASSLGQTLAVLGVKPTDEHRLIAAADHCLAAAYANRCPGVDPSALAQWRAASRAKYQRRPVEKVLADIAAAKPVVASAPTVPDLPGRVRDLRQHGFIPEAPEAAAQMQVPILTRLKARGGRIKITLLSATPQQCRAWPQWAADHHLVDTYGGDPARGFAGGYIPNEEQTA